MRALAITSGEHVIGVTCSAGVVEVAPGERIERVATRADQALYQAKRAGRGRVSTG